MVWTAAVEGPDAVAGRAPWTSVVGEAVGFLDATATAALASTAEA